MSEHGLKTSWSQRTAGRLLRSRYLLLATAVLAVAVAWPIATRLEFDQSIESLFARDNPHLRNYQESKRLFGGDEFVFVAYEDRELFQSDDETQLSESSRARIGRLKESLNQVPGVNESSTQALTTALDVPFPQKRRMARRMVTGVLLGDDGETTSVVLRLEAENQTGASRAETFARIREVAAEFAARNGVQVYVAGEPVQIHDMFRYVEEDGHVLFMWSLALLAVVILILFHNGRWVALPLAVVLAAVVWTEAVLVLLNLKLSMVSSMLNALVTIIGIATVTHVTVRYRMYRRDRPGIDALQQTLGNLGPAITWTCATTAVGFAALLSSQIRPVRSFGVMVALAALLVLPAAASLLPGGAFAGARRRGANGGEDTEPREEGAAAGEQSDSRKNGERPAASLRKTVRNWIEKRLLVRVALAVACGALAATAIPGGFQLVESAGSDADVAVRISAAVALAGLLLFVRWSSDPAVTPIESRIEGGLERLAGLVGRFPRSIGAISAAVSLAGLGGFLWLDVETDLSRNFRRSTPIVRSLEFIESNLGGAGTWEVNFPAPRELTEDYVAKVRGLAERLRQRFGDGERPPVTKVVAITDGLDLVRLPFIADTLEGQLRYLNLFQREFVPTLYNSEAGRMRIMLRSREQQQSHEKLALIERVRAEAQEWADEELAGEDFLKEPSRPEVRATGLFVLLAHLVQSLLRDQLVSFVIAATGICTMMAVVFRNWRIGLISLFPNLFPIVLVIGAMGWITAGGLADLPINIATAMIASVSMGLTVDGTIHYIAEFLRSRDEGLSFTEAIVRTHTSVGRALVFANVALVVGFLVLTISRFVPLIHFGILVSVAMVGGVIADLLILPLLLRWATRAQ